MKRFLIATLLTLTLHAQSLGNASTESAKVAAENSWKNWIFAGVALVAAGVAITIVALNEGSSPQQH